MMTTSHSYLSVVDELLQSGGTYKEVEMVLHPYRKQEDQNVFVLPKTVDVVTSICDDDVESVYINDFRHRLPVSPRDCYIVTGPTRYIGLTVFGKMPQLKIKGIILHPDKQKELEQGFRCWFHNLRYKGGALGNVYCDGDNVRPPRGMCTCVMPHLSKRLHRFDLYTKALPPLIKHPFISAESPMDPASVQLKCLSNVDVDPSHSYSEFIKAMIGVSTSSDKWPYYGVLEVTLTEPVTRADGIRGFIAPRCVDCIVSIDDPTVTHLHLETKRSDGPRQSIIYVRDPLCCGISSVLYQYWTLLIPSARDSLKLICVLLPAEQRQKIADRSAQCFLHGVTLRGTGPCECSEVDFFELMKAK